MPTLYLLLRNNVQSGPYTAEDLLHQQLVPTDLIWTEGGAPGWRYPSEVAELRQQPIPPVKEKRESTLKSVFVSLPAHAQKTSSASQVELSEAEKFRLKAEALYQRAMNQEEVKEDAGEPQTKYSRSLEDIKQEYSAWMRGAQKKKRPIRKSVIIAAAVASIAALLLFVYFLPAQKGMIQTAPVVGMAAPPQIEERSLIAEPAVVTKKVPARPAKKKNDIRKKPSSKTVLQQPSRPQIEVAQPTSSEAGNIAELVKVSGRFRPVGARGVSSSTVTLVNSSSETVKLAAVDVLYFLLDGSAAGRERIYFKNLTPGSRQSIEAPGHSHADDVRFRIGMLSSSESGLFVSRD